MGFRHHKDYQAYVWAKGEHTTQVRHMPKKKLFDFPATRLNFGSASFPVSPPQQVSFSEEDLPRDDCEYMLGFYSNNMNSIVGLSTTIQVCEA